MQNHWKCGQILPDFTAFQSIIVCFLHTFKNYEGIKGIYKIPFVII